MSKPVHVVLGKYSKFEIYSQSGWLKTYFVIYRNDKYWAGEFSSLPEATRYAEKHYYD